MPPRAAPRGAGEPLFTEGETTGDPLVTEVEGDPLFTTEEGDPLFTEGDWLLGAPPAAIDPGVPLLLPAAGPPPLLPAIAFIDFDNFGFSCCE